MAKQFIFFCFFSYLDILNFLDELDVLLCQASLVRGDIDDGAVELFDPDVQFGDAYFQSLGVLDRDQSLLVQALDLGQQFVHFRLEFALLLLGPVRTKTHRSETISIQTTIFNRERDALQILSFLKLDREQVETRDCTGFGTPYDSPKNPDS